MNEIIYAIILIGFAFICFHGVQLKKQEDNTLFVLSRKTTDTLRGYAILSIMIHHLVLKMSSASILLPFRLTGYLGVSVFFFLSGYGLYQASSNKEVLYTRGFLPKRITSVYLPAVFAQLFYMIVMMIGFRQQYTLQSFLIGLFVLQPVDSNQWYILAALYHYLMFWLSLKFLKTWKKRVLFLLLSAIVYFVFCVGMHLSKNWFDTAFCFFLGVTFAAYGKHLFFWLKQTIVTLPVLFVLFGVSVYFSYGREDVTALAFRCLSSIVFVLLTVSILNIVNIENCRSAAFIGSISLECYLMHSKAIYIIKSIFRDIKGKETIVYLILTIFLVFGFSWLMKYYRLLLKRIRKKCMNHS